MKGVIQSVEITHKCPFSDDRVVKMSRMVVWATMKTGERVWVRTVEGALDHTYNEVKIAFFYEFFNGLVGQTIEFEPGSRDGFFAKGHSVPCKFSGPSYPEIKYEMEEWVEDNCAELIKRLNKEKAAKATATKRKNIEYAEKLNQQRREDIEEYGLPEDATDEEIYAAWRKKIDEDSARQEREKREKKIQNALKLAFHKGINRKHKTEQWEAKHKGILYILERRDSYDPGLGEVPVEKVRDLVPGRLVLVKQV